jgi:tetratricopeptide (TPR) repeat protein
MLLHELLTGVRPPPPRQAPSAETAELPLASTHAPTPLRRRELRGELDAIIAMALRVDPSRRYATADALASDIERHLAGDTVTARPDSLAYRLKKAIRRHWVGVAASASVVVAVVVGTSVAWWQSKIALEAVERERIVRSFVTDVFKVNQQEFGSGAGATVRGAKGSDLLEQSAKLVQAKFTDQPQVQAELYGVVGALFFDMGANRLAGDYLQRQLQALAKTKASPSAVAAVHMQTSSLQLREGQAAEAVAAARRALDLSGNTSSQSIDARVLLMRSLIASSDSNEVLAVLEALERDIQGKDGAAERRALAWTRAIKAQRLANANRRDEAPAVFDEAIAMAEAAEGVDAESPLAMRLMAAQVLVTTGQVDRTQAYFDGAMKTLRARGGNHLVRAAFEAARFAARRHVAVQQISYQAALAQFAESRAQLAATNQVLPDEITSQLDFNEATIHMRHGETNKADALFARSLSVVYAAATTPSERFRVALPYVMHVVNVGDPAAALWTDRRVQHRIESGLGHHPYAAFDHVYKARALARAGRLDDALRALDAAPTFEPIRGEGTRNIHVYTDALALERAEILALMGHTTAARAAFPLRQLIPPGEPMESAGFVAIATLALIDCAAGRSEHGMRAWESVLAHMRTQDQSPHAPDSILTRARAGLCAVQAGQRWQATALAREARASLAAHNRISPFILEQVQKLERALSGGATRPGPAT